MKQLFVLLLALCVAGTAASQTGATVNSTAKKTVTAKAPQCTATTQEGKQCSRTAVNGTKYCTQHGKIEGSGSSALSKQCSATTKDGDRCKNKAMKNGTLCGVHGKAKKTKATPKS